MSHQPVLLKEAIEALNIDPQGFYIDGTFGRGGHARAILSLLSPNGRLLVFDKDPQAILEAKKLMVEDSRLIVRHGSFIEMAKTVIDLDWQGKVAGIFLDLGVSSPQLDEAARGFSFLHNGPLDMRMDTSVGSPASDWIATVAEKELANVLYEFGEERYSRRIAKAIVIAREKAPILTTLELAEIIKAAHPKWPQNQHPATRSFQAIRIQINQELEELNLFLPQSLSILKEKGRLVVISFHSLEDRLVKQFVQTLQYDPRYPKDLIIKTSEYHVPMKAIGKMIKANHREIAVNPRARSACLRILEKQ
ncbi:MAG: 16S rRNA (cytosine(1402)-N(4))-methyltransferase [Gammaproteobacteria bacterium RIFCSPHIGHO2_12_FULL_41_15]|nr:MAG: 16S rRNA (cytosine(1402)-N(4))-methyltransferase [Gammaproteobacteria bacterium RIFCSPHIGHO2_12_FULL_41_15]